MVVVALESLWQPHRSTATWVTAWRGRWRGHAVGHGVAPNMNSRRPSATLVDPDKTWIESDHRLGPPRMLHIGLPKGGLGRPQPPKAPAAATITLRTWRRTPARRGAERLSRETATMEPRRQLWWRVRRYLALGESSMLSHPRGEKDIISLSGRDETLGRFYLAPRARE